MNSTTLTLIRHGEAFSNVDPHVVESFSCRGLTAHGIAQAHALAHRIQHEQWQYDVLYASTLTRARMTADIVAPALQLPINWEDDLHELRVGDADGMALAQVTTQFPDFAHAIREPYTKVAPNGESWNEFAMRCARILHTIVMRHRGQRIAVVCHGGVIECAFLWIGELNAGMRKRVAFPARNTAFTTWVQVQSPYDQRIEWQLRCHNDHAHLAQLP